MKAVPHWSSAWATASVWTLGGHVRMRCWPDRLAGTACCSRRCSSSQPLGPGQSRNSCQVPRQFGKWKRGRRGRVHLDKVTASSHGSNGGIMQARSRSRQLKNPFVGQLTTFLSSPAGRSSVQQSQAGRWSGQQEGRR